MTIAAGEFHARPCIIHFPQQFFKFEMLTLFFEGGEGARYLGRVAVGGKFGPEQFEARFIFFIVRHLDDLFE